MPRFVVLQRTPSGYWARTLTPDETKIIQGFPECFQLRGSEYARFTQTGNAVPPPMVTAVVRALDRPSVSPADLTWDMDAEEEEQEELEDASIEPERHVGFVKLSVLVACESSHEVSRRFRELGHDAYSCDLLPADNEVDEPWHIQGDALQIITEPRWDLVIAHPPCTYLCSSGLHWNKRRKANGELLFPDRERDTQKAIEFFMQFTKLQCHWAIENPVGRMSTAFKPPTQYIQPYEYGDDASKKTGLWLHRLPPLTPTGYAEPRMVKQASGKLLPRWSNQDDSGQNNVQRGKDQWKVRSKTWPGVADAMARQWSSHIMAEKLAS